MKSQNQESSPVAEVEHYRILARLVWKRRRTVYRIAGIASIVILIYVFIMPQRYDAQVTVIPVPPESSNMGLSSLLAGGGNALPFMDIGSTLGLGGRPADLYVRVLKSRTVAESLIVHNNLATYFGVPENQSYRHAIEPLQQLTDVEATKDGVINVTVKLTTGYFPSQEEIDSTKQLAADLANQYVYWLDRVNREKLVSRAQVSRKFIEKEIERTQVDLDSAYNRMVRYQEEHKSLIVEKQLEAALQSAAQLKSQILKARVALGLRKKDFSASSPVVEELESQVEQLIAQYQALSSGADKLGDEFYIPFSEIPVVARDLANLLRRVKVLEQVIIYLNQQYYQDRVKEGRNTPTIQVLDEAVPPLMRSSPRRALWMILTVFFSALFAVSYILITDYFSSTKSRKPTRHPESPPIEQ